MTQTPATKPGSGQLVPDQAFLTGRYAYESHPGFQLIPEKFAQKRIYLQREVVTAFLAMAQEAERAGLHLRVISGTRSFQEQRQIWVRKWNQNSGSELEKIQNILKYSSMPGTSRHHWGTDLDLNSLSPEYFRTPEGRRLHDWLTAHASRFGFCQPYSHQPNRKGYQPEPWHWSYFKLAHPYLETYVKTIDLSTLAGFPGANSAKRAGIEDYLRGIDVSCQP